MRIRVVRYVSGMTRGIALPRARNAEIEVPDELGAALCSDGVAVPVSDAPPVERAVPPPDPAVEKRGAPPEVEPDPGELATGQADPAVVRSWAADQGFDVSAQGRLPQALYDAYSAAHSGA